MARKFSFEVNRTSSAPPERLFALVADGARWSDWAKPLIIQSGWARAAERPGDIGAIRSVGLWPVLLREETVEYEQDRKHSYRFAGFAPVKDYLGVVTFTPNSSGGTDVRWSGSFSEKAPGTGAPALAAFRTVIRFLSARLVKAAER
ncbi:SRPBCC family protein [Amycolatopsis sp. CA-230715]|uniref:SRPBCC family protein n=1 Tax=Amycolatopsis sp. CA-230715 TaxID=2745196 RepID=UPI001C0263A3|nr:SRPBCC family protein [Amycolatopsis sp. CA-230715]QWF80008.1 hypothetical protein HUW46_03423 [Amycolatopsis sp. CA-230715]